MKETLRLGAPARPALAEQGSPIAFISGNELEIVARKQDPTTHNAWN
tara:strand:- start:2008 stop:2148 length:141 start_codon:yes stop_codon:yes gene_type:complete